MFTTTLIFLNVLIVSNLRNIFLRYCMFSSLLEECWCLLNVLLGYISPSARSVEGLERIEIRVFNFKFNLLFILLISNHGAPPNHIKKWCHCSFWWKLILLQWHQDSVRVQVEIDLDWPRSLVGATNATQPQKWNVLNFWQNFGYSFDI